ncbi:hypothetical protein M405DRAFT_215824 [Rhizopogon salebrosus TDB-379]|nr:hypothetical protein M405DRAFT_215824 [Rhizopogon salebrosus TDB-379]
MITPDNEVGTAQDVHTISNNIPLLLCEVLVHWFGAINPLLLPGIVLLVPLPLRGLLLLRPVITPCESGLRVLRTVAEATLLLLVVGRLRRRILGRLCL